MQRLIFCLLIAFCVSACSTYSWYHPSKGQSEFNQDKYTCIQQSAQLFPVVMEQETVVEGYTSPSQTICNTYNGQTICTTTPSTYYPPKTKSVDVNEYNRDKAFNSCMKAKGWSFKKDD